MRLQRLSGILGLLAWLVGSLGAQAGYLSRAELERAFPAPFVLGERDEALPVWPIFKQNATATELVAYVYESVDISPIPGFSGAPIDLLVALTPEGTYLDVRVVRFHEPVFIDGLGPEPLFDFVKQYSGKSLKQTIKVGRAENEGGDGGALVVIDGVAKATASVRVVNETLLTAGLRVARAKLGFAQGRDPSRSARIKPDAYEPLDWAGLVARGYIRHQRVSNAAAEAAFKGTPGEGLDSEGAAAPDGAFVDLYVGQLDAPMIGRNLLGEERFARLTAELDGRHALLVVSQGRLSFKDAGYVEGAVPMHLMLDQSGAAVELRDFAWRQPIPLAPEGDLAVFTIKPQSGWDPGSPASLNIIATREKGQILPERISHAFGMEYTTPSDLLTPAPPAQMKGVDQLWSDRALDTTLIVLALGVLTAALFMQDQLTKWSAFVWFRRGFLVFTLGFIGYYAHAQLSIVSFIGAARAAQGEGSIKFLLYDPPSFVLWVYTLATLVLWGRGTFCGWLCPFGATQEFAAALGRRLGIRERRVPEVWDRRLKNVKYLGLAAILVAAFVPNAPAETVAEIEPFKTAITLNYVRALPFVIYAAGLVFGGMFVFRGFCRYLCPLGAAFAALSVLRRWDWLKRRVECGSPCQLCKVKCRYGSIKKTGAIDYPECFQCLDCVVIHNDSKQCVALVVARKRKAA